MNWRKCYTATTDGEWSPIMKMRHSNGSLKYYTILLVTAVCIFVLILRNMDFTEVRTFFFLLKNCFIQMGR